MRFRRDDSPSSPNLALRLAVGLVCALNGGMVAGQWDEPIEVQWSPIESQPVFEREPIFGRHRPIRTIDIPQGTFQLNLGPGSDRPPVAGEGAIILSRNTDQAGVTFGLSQQQLRLGYPLWWGTDGMLVLLAEMQHMDVSTNLVLPDSGIIFPDHLWDIEFGTLIAWDTAVGHQAGILATFGSASDRPFHAARDLTFSATGFWTIPHGRRNAWSLSLYYSPTSEFEYPIPGLAYIWRPNNAIEASLGIPAAIRIRPNSALTISASYTPLTDLSVEARHALANHWQVFCRYQIVSNTYFLSQRVSDRVRLFTFDQRAAVGLSKNVGWGFRLDASAAYLFDRSWFQAVGFNDSRSDSTRVDPGVGFFLRLIWQR